MENKIKVIVRKNPQKCNTSSDREIIFGENEVTWKDINGKNTTFKFNKCFFDGESNKTIFDESILPLVNTFLEDRTDCCVLAYGQTGSGKSFSILGDNFNPGLLDMIFNKITELNINGDKSVSFSVFEIYNEKVIDLIKVDGSTRKETLKIFENREGQIIIQNLRNKNLISCNFKKVIKDAINVRSKHSTLANDESSRSHLVVQINLGDAFETTRFTIIDLAGSECANVTEGLDAKIKLETKNINTSLLNLGFVVNQLAEKKTFISYRSSILTRIIKTSLERGKTTFIIHLNLENFSESVNTIKFGFRSQDIVTKVTKKEKDEKNEIESLEQEINCLKLDLMEKQNRLQRLIEAKPSGSRTGELKQPYPSADTTPLADKISSNIKSILFYASVGMYAKNKIEASENESEELTDAYKQLESCRYFALALVRKTECLIKSEGVSEMLSTVFEMAKYEIAKLDFGVYSP